MYIKIVLRRCLHLLTPLQAIHLSSSVVYLPCVYNIRICPSLPFVFIIFLYFLWDSLSTCLRLNHLCASQISTTPVCVSQILFPIFNLHLFQVLSSVSLLITCLAFHFTCVYLSLTFPLCHIPTHSLLPKHSHLFSLFPPSVLFLISYTSPFFSPTQSISTSVTFPSTYLPPANAMNQRVGLHDGVVAVVKGGAKGTGGAGGVLCMGGGLVLRAVVGIFLVLFTLAVGGGSGALHGITRPMFPRIAGL